MPKKEKRKYIDVNLPRTWERYLNEALEKIGIQRRLEINHIRKSYSGLGKWIIEQFLIENTSYRFKHLNTKEDYVTIYDRKLRRYINVHIKPDGSLLCETCERSDCEHVTAAVNIPEVKTIFKKKDWELPEP